MPTRTPTDWMWAQACEMLDQADRMHRQFFRPQSGFQPRPTWEPPVDMLETPEAVMVIASLPGVPADRIDVTTDGGELVVRAESRFPFSGTRRAVRRLEIPYGHFERRIRLPQMRYEASTRELINGCLTLRLRKINGTGGT